MIGSSSEEVWRWSRGGAPERRSDELVREEPLEIRVEGHPVSVTMRTPGADAELAAGFLVTEGVVGGPDDVAGIEGADTSAVDNLVDVRLAAGVELDLEHLSRHVFASSSCGICGKASIDAVHLDFPPVEADLELDADRLLELPDRLRGAQETFERTGGLHATGLFDAGGDLVGLHEDVGRHNACDKVVGEALIGGDLPLDRHVLCVSGRASFEICQKALAARIPVLVAVSAPSSLACRFARESGQTLVGFCRGDRLNVYAHPERVRFP